MSLRNLCVLGLVTWSSLPRSLEAQGERPGLPGEAREGRPAEGRRWPWKLDTQHRYLWLRQGQKVGETRFKITEVKGEKGLTYTLTSSRTYEREGASQRSEGKTTVLPDGTTLKFEETLDFSTVRQLGSHQVTTIDFAGGKAKVRYEQNGKQGDSMVQEVELPPGTFLFASQAAEHWALFVATFPPKFKQHKVKLFYPDFRKVLDVNFEATGEEKLKVGSSEVMTTRALFRSEGSEIQGTVWIDGKGRLVQLEFPNASHKELSLRVVLASIDDP